MFIISIVYFLLLPLMYDLTIRPELNAFCIYPIFYLYESYTALMCDFHYIRVMTFRKIHTFTIPRYIFTNMVRC